MENLSREEFEELKNIAAQEMRELKGRQTAMPPFPDFVKVPSRQERPTSQPRQNEPESPLPQQKTQTTRSPQSQRTSQNRLGGFLKNINLTEMLKDKDSWLILGLIFLLSNEEADESLILALAYILL